MQGSKGMQASVVQNPVAKVTKAPCSITSAVGGHALQHGAEVFRNLTLGSVLGLPARAAYLQYSARASLLQSVQSTKLILKTSLADGIKGVMHERISQVYRILCTPAM